MTEAEKNSLAAQLGLYLCEKLADMGDDICSCCPYKDKCKNGKNALIEDIHYFITQVWEGEKNE